MFPAGRIIGARLSSNTTARPRARRRRRRRRRLRFSAALCTASSSSRGDVWQIVGGNFHRESRKSLNKIAYLQGTSPQCFSHFAFPSPCSKCCIHSWSRKGQLFGVLFLCCVVARVAAGQLRATEKKEKRRAYFGYSSRLNQRIFAITRNVGEYNNTDFNEADGGWLADYEI